MSHKTLVYPVIRQCQKHLFKQFNFQIHLHFNTPPWKMFMVFFHTQINFVTQEVSDITTRVEQNLTRGLDTRETTIKEQQHKLKLLQVKVQDNFTLLGWDLKIIND